MELWDGQQWRMRAGDNGVECVLTVSVQGGIRKHTCEAH